MYRLEYGPDCYVTCPVIRELCLRDGRVELLVLNPLSWELVYVYDTRR
jgi:hypothetical protein